MEPRTPSILVVDDEIDACQNLRDILIDLDYRVDVAHDGHSALELAGKNAYDVALLDLRMPDMNGLEVYRKIRLLQGDTVPIIISAYASSSIAEKALALGVRYVLRKPVDFRKLLRLVEEALDQPLVLVVDDDVDLSTMLWDLVHERNFRVALAHDEATAAARLQDRRFRVVLIDMKLPKGNGAGVFRRLRQVNPQARAVLITGHRAEVDREVRQLLEEGIDAVFYKPFDVGALLATIERLARAV